jgi:putative tryptophan/tyrosine transport system substrate-binding protein
MRRRDFLAGLLAGPFANSAAAQGQMPKLAILSPTSKTGGHSAQVYEPFTAAIASLGWMAGQNLEIVERFAEDRHERLPALAAELVALHPDVVFTNSAAAAYAAARATHTIPVVVGPAGENVFVELAHNFARPAGNVTGFTLYALGQDEKCLELLKEASPATSRLGVLVNPLNPNTRDYPASVQSAASALGLTLVRMEARDMSEISAAFTAAPVIDGLHVPDDPNLAGRLGARHRIIEITSMKKVPVASTHFDFARDGALLALGTNIPEIARRAAGYVNRILRGAKPEDLPVERPTEVRLGVNLKAARVLGLTMPASLIARADEVIE